MIVAAIFLLIVGVITSIAGAKLFRLLLPLIGLIVGFMVGFTGFQGIFGSNAVSTTVAIAVALVTGVIMALLSFLFLDLALIVLTIAVGAMTLSYLGTALGLREDGFLVFLLAVTGGIIAGVFAVKNGVTVPLVVALTSLLGVAYILVGVMLLVGEVSLDDLSNGGVVNTLLRVVDQSFLWLLVWVGGSLLSMRVQYRVLVASLMTDMFELNQKSLR